MSTPFAQIPYVVIVIYQVKSSHSRKLRTFFVGTARVHALRLVIRDRRVPPDDTALVR